MMMSGAHRLSRCRLCRPSHEAGDVLRSELDPDNRPERVDAELPDILVDLAVLLLRGQGAAAGLARGEGGAEEG